MCCKYPVGSALAGGGGPGPGTSIPMPFPSRQTNPGAQELLALRREGLRPPLRGGGAALFLTKQYWQPRCPQRSLSRQVGSVVQVRLAAPREQPVVLAGDTVYSCRSRRGYLLQREVLGSVCKCYYSSGKVSTDPEPSVAPHGPHRLAQGRPGGCILSSGDACPPLRYYLIMQK